jgi:Glutathione S-transferase, N-terminal domain
LQTYLDVPHKFEGYQQGPAPDFSRDEWLKTKATMGETLEFPNLPYYIDEKEGVKITQSSTIMRYVARKYGAAEKLYEGSPEELAQIDCVWDQVQSEKDRFELQRGLGCIDNNCVPDLVHRR